MPYRVRLLREAEAHLRGLRARERALVRDAIRAQLAHEPEVVTRNRFRMAPNPLAAWELRVPPCRVYYDVEGDEVLVRAIGVKRGNRVRIGGLEVELREREEDA